MSATFNVKLDTAALDAIARNLNSSAREVVEELANDALARSQEIVPVDTGWLKATGAVGMPDNTARAIVAYEAEYAAYVELGTYKMGARPYLLPSVQTAAFKMGLSTTWETLFR